MGGAEAAPGYPHSRWNFNVIALDAAFFMGSLAFIDPVAVLPVLLSRLGGSQIIVGLVGTLQPAGWLLPQLLASSLVLHRPRRKPFVVVIAFFSRLPFIALAVLFNLTWGASHPQMLMLFLILAFGWFFFSDGLIGVPWHDIVARTIRPAVRGRFFGSMQLLSGLLAIVAAALVRYTLADPRLPFPTNYGRLFAYFSVGVIASLVLIVFIREPPGAPVTERQSLPAIVRAIPATLRSHPTLFRLVVVQNIFGISGLALPFYAVYAHSSLHLPEHVGGLFVGAATVGGICASPAWAYVNDRLGCLTVIRRIPVLLTAVPIAALLVPPAVGLLGAQSAMPYAYAIVFFLNGATWAGRWMAFTNYLFEIAPDRIRPLFLGLSATLSAPAVVTPLLGGWLLGFVSYHTLFALVAAGGLAALAAAYRLPDPRAIEAGLREAPPVDPATCE